MKRRFDSSLVNFIKELKAFHGSSGNAVAGFPSISGRSVNLFKLYKAVTSFGGFDRVSYEDKWSLVLEDLNIPEECANASEVVKHIYQRYLEKYERSRKKDANGVPLDFDGDDGADDDRDGVVRFTPMYRTRRGDMFSESRQLFDSSRQNAQNAQSFRNPPMPPNFSRLYKSLLSGLPNEFDLGISACLALSLHDNRIPLLPSHFGVFIELLCAHAGVFAIDCAHLAELYADWRKCDRLQFFKFWSDYIENEAQEDHIDVTNLLFTPDVYEFVHNELYQVSQPKKCKIESTNDSSTVSREGFIIEMIASIFRNLSFDASNAVMMAGSSTLLRFLILGSRCSYRNVSMLCLDTIGRLAPTLSLSWLEMSIESGTMLLNDFVRNLLESDDRARVLAGAEILASLCQNDSNFDDLCSFVDSSLCNRLFQYLLVPDIHLVVNCAEAIYQISELGPVSCDIIASNEKHLTMILALTTVEAVAFGPDAIVNIKVVAQQGGMSSMPQASSQANQRFLPRPMAPMLPGNPRPQMMPPFAGGPLPQNAPQIVFMYASNWLRTVLEPCPPPPNPASQLSESLVELYNEYLAAAAYANNKAVFENVHLFADCIIRVFPFVAIRSPPPGRVEQARVFGIRKQMPTGQPHHHPPTLMSSPPNMPLMPVMPNNMAVPNGEIDSLPNAGSVQKRQILPKPGIPTVNGIQNDPNGGSLHVAGAPMTAAEMIDRERRSHELSILKIENKSTAAKVTNHVNGEASKANAVESNGTNETLDQLLAEDDAKSTGENVVSNGSTELIKVIEKEPTNVKPLLPNGSHPSHHDQVNGYVRTNGHQNGYQNGNEAARDKDGSSNNNSNHDEASIMSSATDTNSAAVYASAESVDGGEASQMSNMSDAERRGSRSCQSNSNNSFQPAKVESNGPSAAPTVATEVNTKAQSLPQPLDTTNDNAPFPCKWGSCCDGYSSADALHRHFVRSHVPQFPGDYGARMACLWQGCTFPAARLKWSLFVHCKEHHLNITSSVPAPRIVHPDAEIPPDAGLRAVLTNFCQTTPFHPNPPGFEGPVTKQMRLAGGLILRNIAKHSANGKRFVHRHMEELVAIAFSGIESSSAVMSALDLADQKL